MTTKIAVFDELVSDFLLHSSKLNEYTLHNISDIITDKHLFNDKGPFDLMIMDLDSLTDEMLYLLKKLYVQGELLHIRLILLLSNEEAEKRVSWLKKEDTFFVRKPISPDMLFNIIDTQMGLLRLHKKMKEEFEAQTHTYNKIYHQAPIGIAVSFNSLPSGADENPYIQVNPVYEEITGYSAETLREKGWIAITHPEDLPENLMYYHKMASGEIEGYTMDKRFVRPDGSFVWVNMVVSKVLLHANHKYNHVSMIQDITNRKEMEQKLRESERSKSVLLSHLPGMAYRCKYDDKWTMEYVSKGAKELTGYDPEELLGNTKVSFEEIIAEEFRKRLRVAWHELLPKRKNLHQEYEIIMKNGKRLWVLEIGQGIYNDQGEVEALEGIILDASQKKRMEENLQYQMDHDRWTGLYNQNHLDKLLAADLQNEDGTRKALLAVNLSYLHFLNLVYGFHYTQELIKKIADTLLLYTNQGRLLFKLQDNQFVFYCQEVSSKEELIEFVEDLHRGLEHLLLFERMTIGFGVVEFQSNHGVDEDQLLKSLLIASEKGLEHQGELPLCFFDKKMEEGLIREDEIRKELAQITDEINPERLTLHYQPILKVKSNEIVGFEALARLTSQGYGMVPPLEFISIAEKSKLIIPLGERIIQQALIFIKKLQSQTKKDYWVSINVSPLQLLKKDFCENLFETMRIYDVSAASVHIEITETVFSSNYEDINKALGTLKEHGIDISLDDFGTGYSSLSRERELNINCLKIDKSFIDKLLVVDPKSAITGDIIVMAHRLGHSVIAEGVEDLRQLDYLHAHHCDFVQGYYFYKPMTEEQILSAIQSEK